MYYCILRNPCLVVAGLAHTLRGPWSALRWPTPDAYVVSDAAQPSALDNDEVSLIDEHFCLLEAPSQFIPISRSLLTLECRIH